VHRYKSGKAGGVANSRPPFVPLSLTLYTYLLLYNLIFVAPLIAIFLAGRLSVDATSRLQASFRSYIPAIKGLTALLFTLLSSYMLYQAYMFVRYGALG